MAVQIREPDSTQITGVLVQTLRIELTHRRGSGHRDSEPEFLNSQGRPVAAAHGIRVEFTV
jgi:hypothetical protein